MANDNLTGNKIADTYNQLLITADTGGITGSGTSATQIHCGGATAGAGNADTTALYLSTTAVGIGTSTPDAALNIEYTTGAMSAQTHGLIVTGDAGSDTAGHSASIFLGSIQGTTRGCIIAAENEGGGGDNRHNLVFMVSDTSAAPTEAMRIDHDGNVGIGGAPANIGGTQPSLQVEANNSGAGISVWRNTADSNPPYLYLGKSRGTATGAYTIVQDNDIAGDIIFQAADGTDRAEEGIVKIRGMVDDASPAANAIGGMLHIMTSTAAGVATSAMVIDAKQNMGLGTTLPGGKLHIYDDLPNPDDLGDWDHYQLIVQGHTTTGDTAGILLTTGTDTYGGSAIIHEDTNSGSVGDLIFYTKQSTAAAPPVEVLRLKSNARVGINDSVPEGTLTVNQLDEDGLIIALKSSDVAHGMTDLVETDTFGRIKKCSAGNGGLFITGLSETGTQDALKLNGYSPDEQATRSTGALGFINIVAALKSSATVANVSADRNLVTIRNNATTRYIFDSDGSAHADIEWVPFSDSRLKSSVEDIPYGLATVLQMQPKRYDKQSGDFDSDGNVVLEDNKRKMIGFMAQDIKAIIPELVKDVDETKSFYSLNYDSLTAVLVKAIQELSAKVTALENA